jgi:protein TonB
MNFGSRRLLAAALLVSIALHVVILALPILREARDTFFPAPPIQARLVEPAPPAPVAAPEPQRAEPRVAPRAEPAPKKASPRPVPRPEPAPVTPPLPSPPATAEPERSAEKVEAKPSPAAPSASAAVTASPAPAASAGQEATTAAQYRLALMQAMGRDRVYPRIARENGWEGRVTLRVVINPAGGIGALEVRSSAGYDVLDRRALDMLRNAQAQTPLPAALRGREHAFEIPVEFNLKDAR